MAIAQGGRLALSRAMAALGATSVGYHIPDYTAYEDIVKLVQQHWMAIGLDGWTARAG